MLWRARTESITLSTMWERAPFSKCPSCSIEHSFGVLSVGGNGMTLRCAECRYAHTESLPDLDKAVIYLDQFVFSELHKLRSGQRRRDGHSTFWEEVGTIVNRVVLLQQAVMPHSDIHNKETIVYLFPQELRESYEHIGGDLAFRDTDDVELQQIFEFAQAYIVGREPTVSLGVETVLQGERNEWLPDIRIGVGMDTSSFANSIRAERNDNGNRIEKPCRILEGQRTRFRRSAAKRAWQLLRQPVGGPQRIA